MRSTPRWLFAAALAISIAGCKEEDKGAEHRVVVLFTTDEHSQLFASSPEIDDFLQAGTLGTGALKGGVMRRMTILEAQRAAAAARGAATLTLSSGDFSQGSLASAAWVATSPELAMMSRMGYDAVALGNHEFDLGPKALAAAIVAAGTELPPLVLTNLNFSDASAADDDLKALYDAGKIAPYRILTTSNGLRIGIVASMGVAAGTVAGAAPPVTFWTGATNTERFSSYAARLQGAVNEVRAQGVDAVILLGHGGIGASQLSPGEDEVLALQLTGVDVVLSGHSHLFTPAARMVYGSGKAVPVVQPKPYGQNVGKIELVFRDDGEGPRPFLDPSGTQFLDVDDRTPGTTDAAFRTDLFTRTVGVLEAGLPGTTTAPSFLEATLSRVTGTPVTDDPAQIGDLWLKPLGQLDFDVIGNAPGETNSMNLDTDAIRAAVRGIDPATCPSCAATEIGVQASGPIRGDLVPGTTGALAFADIYHVVPLGGDPTAAPTGADPDSLQNYLNAVPGYPLVRFNVPTVSLRIVYEATLQTALFVNGDFFLGASGLEVRYDITRTPFDTAAVDPASPATLLAPGWVTYMALGDGTVLYDVSNPAYAATGGFPPAMLAPTSLRSIATTLYVASFASSFGITLFSDAGAVLSPGQTIVARQDGSHIKDFEALGSFVAAACAGNTAHAGYLPSEYGAAVPRRIVNCTGGCP